MRSPSLVQSVTRFFRSSRRRRVSEELLLRQLEERTVLSVNVAAAVDLSATEPVDSGSAAIETDPAPASYGPSQSGSRGVLGTEETPFT